MTDAPTEQDEAAPAPEPTEQLLDPLEELHVVPATRRAACSGSAESKTRG